MYLLIYMLNGYDLPGLTLDENLDRIEVFNLVKKLKEKTTISRMF